MFKRGAKEQRKAADGPAGQIPIVACRLLLADEAEIDHVANLARIRQTKTVSCFAPPLAKPPSLHRFARRGGTSPRQFQAALSRISV